MRLDKNYKTKIKTKYERIYYNVGLKKCWKDFANLVQNFNTVQ